MFQNFISLGVNCLTASALAKYGLRSFSGPFDWCTSNFMEGIIPLLESDFDGFMEYRNLQADREHPHIFDDLKYKINYNHDVKENFQKEYSSIKEKYQRRIERFRKEIACPTCFVRVVWSMEELSAIHENEDRIKKAIKKYPDNEIIYVIPRFIYERNPVALCAEYFLVDTCINGFALGREESRSLFDTNKDLIAFCINHYNIEKRKDNLIFDLQAELKVAREKWTENRFHAQIENMKKTIVNQQKACVRIESRNALWIRLLNVDFNTIVFPEKISIYGCGAMGRTFYQKVKQYCNVAEFIDKEPRQEFYEGVPVVTVEQSKTDANTIIIVIPSYDYPQIVENLSVNYGYKPKTVPIEEFIAAGSCLDPNF